MIMYQNIFQLAGGHNCWVQQLQVLTVAIYEAVKHIFANLRLILAYFLIEVFLPDMITQYVTIVGSSPFSLIF